jgi:16S rRNA (cytosine1402-N4)-methyltransferase
MARNPAPHIPVMAAEITEYLSPKKGNWIFTDCTAGYGGHSELILNQLYPGNEMILIDRDEDALRYCQERFKDSPHPIRYYQGGFEDLTRILDEDGNQTADAFLFDCGFSSPQIDQGGRGFSFMHEGPLDMRMDRRQLLKAEDIVNGWEVDELTQIFSRYGEERFSRRIAKAIVRQRQTEGIRTTQELADVVLQAIPEANRYQEGIHPATRVFQALRIVVNNELESLRRGLQGALERLRPGGRIAVLSYHSLEHRIVKELFRSYAGVELGPPGKPELMVRQESRGRVLTRKSIRPCAAEREQNPRCRSAQLRVLERYAED